MSLDQIGAYITGIDYAAWADSSANFVKDWQTMIAGVLALTGAWATVASVNRQIRHNSAVEQRRRADEARAARAVIPLALSELSFYSSRCIKVLAALDGQVDGVVFRRTAKELPTAPSDLVGSFKGAIRFSEGDKQEQISDLLAWFQVHEARLATLRLSGSAQEDLTLGIPDLIVSSAELHARATKLFHWARGDLERFPRSDILASVRECLLDYEAHPNVMRLLNPRPRPPANP